MTVPIGLISHTAVDWFSTEISKSAAAASMNGGQTWCPMYEG